MRNKFLVLVISFLFSNLAFSQQNNNLAVDFGFETFMQQYSNSAISLGVGNAFKLKVLSDGHALFFQSGTSSASITSGEAVSAVDLKTTGIGTAIILNEIFHISFMVGTTRAVVVESSTDTDKIASIDNVSTIAEINLSVQSQSERSAFIFGISRSLFNLPNSIKISSSGGTDQISDLSSNNFVFGVSYRI